MNDKRRHFATVGFVGLGMMGLPMARHLVEVADEVLVHDVRAEAVAAAIEHPRIRAAAGLPEIAARSDMVLTCLPGPDILQPVHLGPDGLVAGAHDGLIIVELSTTSPEVSAHIENAYAATSAHYVEAMMIGPPATARSRELYFIVAGNEHARSSVEVALSAMGRGASWVGGIGMASRAKLLHNGLGMIHMGATAEIMGLCIACGIDPDAFIEIIRQSPRSKGIGYSTVFDLYAASIAHGRSTGTGKLYIAAKDTKLAGDLARKLRYPTPLLDEAAAIFQEAMQGGLGEEEYTIISRIIEERYGSAIFGGPDCDAP